MLQLNRVKMYMFLAALVHNLASYHLATQACNSSLLFFTALIIAITANDIHAVAPNEDRAYDSMHT